MRPLPSSVVHYTSPASDPLCLFLAPPLWALQTGDTALIAASLSGRLEVVRLLIEGKADIHAASKVCPAQFDPSRPHPTPSILL
jgi:ankyrin repeat protein